MKPLEIHVIDVVADLHHTYDEEEKISSSSTRKRLLGTLLRSPLKVRNVFFSISQEIKFLKCLMLFQTGNISVFHVQHDFSDFDCNSTVYRGLTFEFPSVCLPFLCHRVV